MSAPAATAVPPGTTQGIIATVTPAPTPPPPLAQAYVTVSPAPRTADGVVLVPINFLMNSLGASAGQVEDDVWRIVYFQHTVDLHPFQKEAIFDGRQVTLPTEPQMVDSVFYVPWQPIADLFGVAWKIMPPTRAQVEGAAPVMLLQYPAAYILDIRHSIDSDKLRIVLDLSGPTRVVASQENGDIRFHLSAARVPGVGSVIPVNDYLASNANISSGNWQADLSLHLNYAAPISWFTFGSPTRLVIDVQRLFLESNSNDLSSGLSLTRVRRGLSSGPVEMFLLRIDPNEGWRLRIAPAGYNVFDTSRPSQVARANRALVAFNGGYFATDGAAVGAVLVDGIWLRFPWYDRTAIGFKPDGTAKIDNLSVNSQLTFASGMKLPVQQLNGWPYPNSITVMTDHFRHWYKMHPHEIAVVVRKGMVVAKPGGGGVGMPEDGYTIVANGSAVPYLNVVKRGEKVTFSIEAPGWEEYTSALGAGPRLVRDSQIDVTAEQERFRSDVRDGRGPRTAIGIDSQGHYLVLVVDGRQPFYSVGLTLTELADIMQQYGAVDALSMDGGGSTAIAVEERIINRPSDGVERPVANTLMVTH